MSPRVRLPLGSLRAQKSISKALTFYSRGSRQLAKSYAAPTRPPTEAQLAQREIVRQKVAIWKGLSPAQRAPWEAGAAARGEPWSGYTLFMSLYEIPYFEFMSILDFRKPGRYHAQGIIQSAYTTSAATAGRHWAFPFYCGRSKHFDRIAYRVTTAASGAQTLLGIFKDTGDIYPGELVLQSAILPGTPAGFYEDPISFTSEDYQLYWLSLHSSHSPTCRGIAATQVIGAIFGQDSGTGTTGPNSLYIARAWGDFPPTFPPGATFHTGTAPCVFLRRST